MTTSQARRLLVGWMEPIAKCFLSSILQFHCFLTAAPASSLFRVLMRGTHECWCGTGFSQREMRPHTHTHTVPNTPTRERPQQHTNERAARSSRRGSSEQPDERRRGHERREGNPIGPSILRGCEICGASSRLLVVLQFRPISYTPIQCPFISGFWFNTPKTSNDAERPWCEKLHRIPPAAPVGRGYSQAIGNSASDLLTVCIYSAHVSLYAKI